MRCRSGFAGGSEVQRREFLRPIHRGRDGKGTQVPSAADHAEGDLVSQPATEEDVPAQGRPDLFLEGDQAFVHDLDGLRSPVAEDAAVGLHVTFEAEAPHEPLAREAVMTLVLLLRELGPDHGEIAVRQRIEEMIQRCEHEAVGVDVHRLLVRTRLGDAVLTPPSVPEAGGKEGDLVEHVGVSLRGQIGQRLVGRKGDRQLGVFAE